MSQYAPQIGPAEQRLQRLNRGRISPSLRAWIYERDGRRCVDCGARDRLSLDHLLPASAGGTEWASNLVTRCSDCNNRRHVQWTAIHGISFYPTDARHATHPHD